MVVRVAGINLSNERRIDVALTAVYGIGRSLSAKILAQTQINPATKIKDLTADEEARLRSIIEKDLLVEGDLRREIAVNIKRLKDLGTYRGQRHIRKLPVRGQRTRTNARTKRGKRMTMGSGRKKSSDKT
jgi:small subunit ribosomal protein S13